MYSPILHFIQHVTLDRWRCTHDPLQIDESTTDGLIPYPRCLPNCALTFYTMISRRRWSFKYQFSIASPWSWRCFCRDVVSPDNESAALIEINLILSNLLASCVGFGSVYLNRNDWTFSLCACVVYRAYSRLAVLTVLRSRQCAPTRFWMSGVFKTPTVA